MTVAIEGEEDTKFSAEVARYERLYARYAKSASPRSELAISAVAFGLAVGVIWFVIARIGDFTFHQTWLTLSFCVPFCYALFDATAAQAFLFDECLFRLSNRFGFAMPAVTYNKRLKDLPRDFLCVGLMFSEMALLAWFAEQRLMDFFPVLRAYHYTGGG